MSVTIGVWMLCQAVAVTLAAGMGGGKTYDPVTCFIGMAIAVPLANLLGIQPGAMAVAAGVIAAWELLRGLPDRMLPAFTGGLSGFSAAMLASAGLPWGLSLPLALLFPGTAFYLRRRNGFAPLILRQQALLGLSLVSVVLAAAPGVIGGWRSAVALNMSVDEMAVPLPVWLWFFAVLALLCGVLRGWWKYR